VSAGRIDDCTGVILAGGRAARLGGFAKGLLRLEGEPLVARTLRLFESLFPASVVIANDAAPYQGLGAEVLPDVVAGKGAPGGVHAALRAGGTGWIFTAACDMPFLAEGPIRFLAARRQGVAVVLVRSGGRLHPLHAFWSSACLAPLERMLAAGNPSLIELSRAVPAAVVEDVEWRAADPEGRALENVNTAEDAARLGLGYQL
jgi:molybdopterin-guanine dinucleotide biosynthesis protein A